MANDAAHRLVARDSSNGLQDTTPTLSGLLTTLIPALISFVVMVLLFVILRKSNRRMYMPRTYIGYLRPSQRTPESPTGTWDWIKAMYQLPDTYVLQHHSMDAYLMLRFLKLCSIMLFVGCCITFPILWPVNATGGGGKIQLNKLSISNIHETQYGRYYAHCFLAWIFVSFIFFMITREHLFYINLRQAYLFSPAYAGRLSSRTVLFTTVTQDLLNKDKLRTMFGRDKVKNVWIATDTKELEEKVEERDAAAMMLEGAETKLIVLANKARSKALKKQGSAESPETDIGDGQFDDESGSVAARWVEAKDRPTHRLTMLIGKKVDTINWARSEIERLSPEIEELQAKHRAGETKLVSSVFIEFYNQSDAQASFQSVAHNLPLHMSPRYIGLDPTQVIWSNLRIKWWERLGRYAGTLAFVCAMIVFWAIPTAVVGAISNIDSLTKIVHFLRFINSVPSWIKGVITGLLPTVMMAVLMALVPIILRLMAKLGGAPSLAAVELTVQNWFFAFQIVQVFLVVTVASSATSVVSSIIHNPSSAASLLAQKIPTASNFYISYIILQGLSFSAGALLQISSLILGKVLGRLLDSTPRKIYTRWSSLSGLGWGTVYPSFTLLTVVAIVYSCIAPLVMGFGTIGLYLFYFAFRYNLLYVSNATIDTQGRSYTRALQHLTVGCYLSVVCLIGLFAIGTGANRMALGPLILMIIFLVFVILFHISMNTATDPLLNYLPKNLEAEEESLLAAENANISTLNEKSKIEDLNGASGSISAPRDSGVANMDNGLVDSAEKGLTENSSQAPKPNVFTKFLRPDLYHNYYQLRKLVPGSSEVPTYSAEVERDAYCHPAINSQPPLLWIPRDALGVSSQEVAHTSRVIPITDEDAYLDENCRIQWNEEKGQPPIYEEKIDY
ncbi:DUF221 domain protein [Penicillium digitatum]|uniref:DUF221 domain-containing protein n=3 Tax=Penicillium digitatum TaxID=36651 RepID=K9GA53_PEND2|nr:hypothetical protein PDIP_57300 [Penicillium digitatum Pd1]EKV11055.1 hypothetical protein PDIP_57300 [Penicillium digitatum Pd1]EKV11778.1 hypothetical protein PDIG_47920 [Penicillium digitatum PHI26]QQK43906.1 DUF221 domain protein [Penicillium digitatum]